MLNDKRDGTQSQNPGNGDIEGRAEVSNPALEHARLLIARGLLPIPIPHKSKRPRIDGWQDLRLTSDDLYCYFNGRPANIGTLLGEPAGWIVDVDLDHARAVELADTFLPATGMTWGRASKPRSHRLYRLTRPTNTRKWKSRAGEMIVELRSTGCQTIAPGSTHPSGEPVRWDEDGDPTLIDPADLMAALESLAGAVRAELAESAGAADAPVPRPAVSPPGGTSNYGREALRREAATVAGTSEGSRNDTLNRAAFNIGTLISGGEVTQADAEAQLLAAAQQCGLPEIEARRTIASGIASGVKYPRKRQARSEVTGRAETVMETTALSLPFAPIPASDLIRDYPELRPVVIADLLREGETMNVVAAPKVGKSWLVHGLAVAVASGGNWLGKQTTQGRVLLIDGELHRETLAERLLKTQLAMGSSISDMALLDVWAVRGQRLTIEAIATALEDLPEGQYRLIVVDALYRFLPLDGEENANETMTRVYNALDRIAKRSGASVVVVHHATKGSQSEKAVTDVGAGAGSQSRAADCHLVLRAHEEDDAVVVDAVVRSFPPMEPFVIRSTMPGWALAPDLDPKQLRKPTRRGNPAKAGTPAPQPVRCWTPEDFAREIVGHERSIRDDVIARGVARGLSKGQSESLLKRAMEAGKVLRHQDGPSAPHRFSIDHLGKAAAGEGGMVGTNPAPGAAAPGGMGGTRAPPPPPPPPPPPSPLNLASAGQQRLVNLAIDDAQKDCGRRATLAIIYYLLADRP